MDVRSNGSRVCVPADLAFFFLHYDVLTRYVTLCNICFACCCLTGFQSPILDYLFVMMLTVAANVRDALEEA